MTWQVGDLAVGVGQKNCPYIGHSPVTGKTKGKVLRVVAVDVWHDGKRPILYLDHDDPDAYCGGCFRKVVRDQHEACEPEFVTLLKRKRVTA